MKGGITLKILEFIGEETINALDLTVAILNAGYGVSYSKAQYEFSKIKRERIRRQIKNEQEKEKIRIERIGRKRFIDMLYNLKKDGLIKEEIKNNNIFFRITPFGEIKLKALRERNKNILPLPNYEYSKNDKFIIITFDIPEIERRKRNWLRLVLKNLGFKFIQRSVCLGKIKISSDFLNDLNKLKLASYIEIFEITKTGTLKHLI